MMRPFALFLCLCLVGTMGRAAEPSPEPEDDNDAKKIIGTWELVRAEMDGKQPPARNAKEMRFEITKDQFIVTTVGINRKESARYKLDMKSKPRSIDITPKGEKDVILKGIYKIEKGELTMCWGELGAERPMKFDEKAKTLMVLRKAKGKDEK